MSSEGAIHEAYGGSIADCLRQIGKWGVIIEHSNK
ncbi:hypothetical protein H1P_690014 [Hyella patelloides LEGE 07179]|uniref:Uncharacterized protein n=1 Tax=Hyella patelloides LEGE 07179 TaxID=945734 RepID=A0A563W308_9CYAN|nr:hypothetical protein H1P_690014 [Hyella patelloides LEGE 07179]